MGENKNLKLRFKLKELEFEIEGNETTVKEEFENFKGFVTNDILPQINKVPNESNISSVEKKPLALDQATEDVDAEEVSEFPILKEVVYKDLPNNEKEWVLIYCFYASDFGTKSFTKNDISSLYESSKRKSDETVKRLSRNIKSVLSKDYIKMINDDDFIIKPEGVKQAKLILEDKSARRTSKNTSKSNSGTNQNKSTGKSKNTSKTQEFKLDRNLNLRPEGKQSLKEYFETFNVNATPERILLIVYYLKEILQLENVHTDHIYTSFDKLNIRVPKSLYQLISDTKNKSGWLEFDTMENIGLSIQGRNAIKYDLSKS